MEIKDLAGLSNPICKLVETFNSGCSWLLKPIQIKRLSDATNVASSAEVNMELKKIMKEAVVTDAIEATHSIRTQRQHCNIVDIYSEAAQELSMIDSITDIPIDVDWTARFFDYAKDISDNEAQILWGKILAGEIKSPGSFSTRTLTVLRDINTTEAKWFVDSCQFILDGSFIPSLVLTSGYYPYNQLLSLFDCGLFTQVQCTCSFNENVDLIESKTITLKIQSSGKKEIELKGYAMTDAGKQLYKLIQTDTHKTYMIKLKENIEQRYNITLELI